MHSAPAKQVLDQLTVLPPSTTALPLPQPPMLPHAAMIANLVKGASGQAIQNMNLLFGVPEETSLLQQALFP